MNSVYDIPIFRSEWVSPFGHPRVTGCLGPLRGLSHPATSFFIKQCRGIHHAPFAHYENTKLCFLFVVWIHSSSPAPVASGPDINEFKVLLHWDDQYRQSTLHMILYEWIVRSDHYRPLLPILSHNVCRSIGVHCENKSVYTLSASLPPHNHSGLHTAISADW